MTFIKCLFIVVDTYMDITSSYEEWSAWGACSASCGVMGTQQRTRGCNHTCILLGMMKFYNQCPIFGKESQVCSGACTQTAASVTLKSPGNCYYYSHFSRFRSVVAKSRCHEFQFIYILTSTSFIL